MARTVQFPRADADGNTVKVEGQKSVVEKIIAAMQQVIKQRDNQTTETIDIPMDKHRSLIGRGGDIKKGLEANFNVSIDIPRQGNGTAISITGLPSDVENAKVHILELVQDQAGETVHVPKKLHHTVADNGQLFRRLRTEHHVVVDHAGEKPPPKPTTPNARTNGGSLPLITDDESTTAQSFNWSKVNTSASDIDGTIPWILRGPPDNIPKATSFLEAAIAQASAQNAIGYLTLPDPKSYRFVIGPGGKVVNGIRSATGCKIMVPRNGEVEHIEIVGSEEGVEKAKEMVLDAVKEGSAGRGGERH